MSDESLEGLAKKLADAVPEGLRSVRAADSFIPLGPPAATVLVNEEQIVAAAREAIA